eukprot:m.2414 g.2414  ORF g.2414 m.2414 type:complete len:256 (+) comp8641_c0_seq2:100-867(+)
MADELCEPRSLLINSGNISKRNSYSTSRKGGLDAMEEVSFAIESTLDVCNGCKNAKAQGNLRCRNPSFTETVEEKEREELKLTVKIFMNESEPELISEAVGGACDELNVSYLDLVVLALPFEASFDSIKSYWTKLEELVEQRRISNLGVCNLDKTQLEELFNWAKIKPILNQITIDSCCFLPKELTVYAKENKIRLSTTNDPHDILPSGNFHRALSGRFTNPQAWKVLWLSRYSTMFKSRGVLRHKGYLLKCLEA